VIVSLSVDGLFPKIGFYQVQAEQYLQFADYLLTKGNVFIGHLYNGTPSNKHYYYHFGWNIQAAIAYLCGIALPFAGFVGTLGAKVSTQASDLGDLGWLLSFSCSFVVYVALCSIWPTKNQKLIKEMGLSWEEASGDAIIAEDGTEIVQDGAVVREKAINDDGDAVLHEPYVAKKDF
jgi:NCS1 family nucleobase:cation symporter-1